MDPLRVGGEIVRVELVLGEGADYPFVLRMVVYEQSLNFALHVDTIVHPWLVWPLASLSNDLSKDRTVLSFVQPIRSGKMPFYSWECVHFEMCERLNGHSPSLRPC